MNNSATEKQRKYICALIKQTTSKNAGVHVEKYNEKICAQIMNSIKLNSRAASTLIHIYRRQLDALKSGNYYTIEAVLNDIHTKNIENEILNRI